MSRNGLYLKAEVDLHNVLNCFMRLRYEHIEKEDSEEGATLLVGQLQAALLCGKSELEDRLEHKRRHEMVEKLSRLVHLVTATDD